MTDGPGTAAAAVGHYVSTEPFDPRAIEALSPEHAYTAEAIKELDPGSCDASGYAFQVEMTWRAKEAGLTIAEVPIRFRDRELGESKMSAGIAIEAIALITRWGWRRRFGG